MASTEEVASPTSEESQELVASLGQDGLGLCVKYSPPPQWGSGKAAQGRVMHEGRLYLGLWDSLLSIAQTDPHSSVVLRPARILPWLRHTRQGDGKAAREMRRRGGKERKGQLGPGQEAAR